MKRDSFVPHSFDPFAGMISRLSTEKRGRKLPPPSSKKKKKEIGDNDLLKKTQAWADEEFIQLGDEFGTRFFLFSLLFLWGLGRDLSVRI